MRVFMKCLPSVVPYKSAGRCADGMLLARFRAQEARFPRGADAKGAVSRHGTPRQLPFSWRR